MVPTFANHQCVVFDDFLPAKEWTVLWKAFRAEPLKYLHVPDIQKVYRVHDGHPLESSGVLFLTKPMPALLPDADLLPPEEWPFYSYPTGRPVDAFLMRIRALARRHARMVGKEGADWVAVQAKTYVYPAQAGLSWHDDGGTYSGAYAYYIHREWDPQWAGELLIADDDNLPRWSPDTYFDHSEQSRALLRRGLGQYIMPKPNRLVLIKGGVTHRIAPVSPAAGDHLRSSIAGFFISTTGLRPLVTR